MKTIVTHIGPDLDAITSVWLVKTFLPEWEEAGLAFVPAGTTLEGKPPDSDPDILHVDTGFGRFDHHQTDVFTCASVLLYEYIARVRGENAALDRLVQIVNQFDHFREVYYPEPDHDRYEFMLPNIIDGLRLIYDEDPLKLVSLGMECMDAIYKNFQNKIWAEKEIQEKGKEFVSPWGKAIAFETINDTVIHLSQKKDYALVIRKDPNKHYLRIKALPRDDIDLTGLYERLKTKEPEATWFLHASRHMILNGSSKNPDMKPSTRPLTEIIEEIKELHRTKN